MRLLWILGFLWIPGWVCAMDPLTRAFSETAEITANPQLQRIHLLVEANRTDEAMSRLEPLSTNIETREEALLAIAMLHGDTRTVSNICRKLGPVPSHSAISGLCYAHLFQLTNQKARALEVYQSIADKTADLRAQIQIGMLHSDQGRHDAAAMAFRRAIDQGAGYRAWLGLGIALEQLGSLPGATAALKRAVEMEPLSALSQYHYGRILGSGPVARQHLTNAMILRPQWVDALSAMARSTLNDGDAKEAILLLNQGIAIDPNRADLYAARAQAHLQNKAAAESKADLRRAQELQPGEWEALFFLASVELATGNQMQAARTVERALSLSQNSPLAHRKAALFYFRAKRHTRANTHFQKLLEFEPNNVEALLHLGDIACERKRSAEGIEYYRKALKEKGEESSDRDIQDRIRNCR
jgi:tetratricopeptide (TPR) repeat protein